MNKVKKNLLLLLLLVSFMLAACDAKLNCTMQAVAGGSQYCEKNGEK